MPSAEPSTLLGDLPPARRLLTRARYDALLWIVCSFGAGLITYLYQDQSIARWIIGVVTFLWMGGIVTITFFHVAYQEERADKQQQRVRAEVLRARLDDAQNQTAISLTTNTIKFFTPALRVVTEELRAFAQSQLPGQGHEDRETARWVEVTLLRQRMVQSMFSNLRSVFEADARGVDTTTWPHNFFKTALFEPKPSPTNARTLRRTYYDYPEGIEPSPKTDTFDIVEYGRTGVVLAFLNQTIVVIEDIKSENQKPPDVKRWMNKRENQADEYGSMVCAAIVSGRRNEPDRQCLGVLVIDTNRERYFKEERFFQAFLGNLLNPFRTALTFILEFHAYLGIHRPTV